MHRFLLISTVFLLSARSHNTTEEADHADLGTEEARYLVQTSSEINWEQLNPARGDASPQAGTIWGDRKGEVATGFLAKFVDGFSSPPHIHNVSYRAIVLDGEVHNDDPQASDMWMPKGSFWTQPAGESHITSARGELCIAYVEIESGPYLVKPIEEAFDNGERPVNIHRDNLQWLDHNESEWIAESCSVELSPLWESDERKGYFLRVPANTRVELSGLWKSNAGSDIIR